MPVAVLGLHDLDGVDAGGVHVVRGGREGGGSVGVLKGH